LPHGFEKRLQFFWWRGNSAWRCFGVVSQHSALLGAGLWQAPALIFGYALIYYFSNHLR
jgi:hypothetical protein